MEMLTFRGKQFNEDYIMTKRADTEAVATLNDLAKVFFYHLHTRIVRTLTELGPSN